MGEIFDSVGDFKFSTFLGKARSGCGAEDDVAIGGGGIIKLEKSSLACGTLPGRGSAVVSGGGGSVVMDIKESIS